MSMAITMLEPGDKFCTMLDGELMFWNVTDDGAVIPIPGHGPVVLGASSWKLNFKE